MNRYNKEQEHRYAKQSNLSFLRGPRRFKSRPYSFRSPELEAMTAHLRAAGYRHRKQTLAAAPANLIGRDQARNSRSLSFSNLLRDYDNQARNNFTREALLFAVIVLIGILWPLAQMFRDLPR